MPIPFPNRDTLDTVDLYNACIRVAILAGLYEPDVLQDVMHWLSTAGLENEELIALQDLLTYHIENQ